MKTKLLVMDEPIELIGKGIKPTMEVWIARDSDGTVCVFDSKPEMSSHGWWFNPNENDDDNWGGLNVFGPLADKMQTLVEPGECKKFRISFEEILDD